MVDGGFTGNRCKIEHASLARLAPSPDFAAHHLHQVFAYGLHKAGATILPVVDMFAWLKGLNNLSTWFLEMPVPRPSFDGNFRPPTYTVIAR